MCERSGVINIAIEGQLLFGAFPRAVVASVVGVLWLGLIVGVAGRRAARRRCWRCSRSATWWTRSSSAWCSTCSRSGSPASCTTALMVPVPEHAELPGHLQPLKIPLLGDIPIIGPVFFDSTIFLYITYALIVLVQVGLFRTRWGLRVRAVGEHPMAADTVGIRVLGTRYRNVILGGLIAGIGGAYLTIGSVGLFGKDMSSGYGYIALAAMIFGRWTPLGALAAALLFGFATAAAVDPVDAQRPDPVEHPADGPVRGDDHRGGRPGRPGPGARRRRKAVRQGMSRQP